MGLTLAHGALAQTDGQHAEILFVASQNLSATVFEVTPEARCVSPDSGMTFNFNANSSEPESMGLAKGVPFIIGAAPPKGLRGCAQRVVFVPTQNLKYVAVFHATKGGESCSLDVVALPAAEVIDKLRREDSSWQARKVATQVAKPCAR